MGAIEAARERFLAAQTEFKTFVASHGGDVDHIEAAHEDAAVSLAEAVSKAHGQYTKALEAGQSSAGDPRPGLGNGIPFPGGHGSAGRAGPPSYYGGRIGDAVLDSLTQGGRFNAAVLTGGSTAVPVPLNPNPVRIGFRTEFLRSLIPGEDAPAGQFSYMQQTVRTNNATVVAPGALKPTSVHTLARINDHTRMVATLSEPLNRVDLADAALLRGFLDSELALDLDLATDDQILNGLGTGDLMTGITHQSGVQTQAFVTDIITTIRKSLTKLRVSELRPDGIVLNPADWEKVELAAMATFAAKDRIGTPVDSMIQTLFGVPVVQSNAQAAGSGVVGAWAQSSALYTTGNIDITWSENSYDPNALGAGVGATDFSRNVLRFRAELRAQVAWIRPAGFVLATLA